MRTFGRVWVVVAWGLATVAMADPNDFVLSKLGNPAGPNGKIAQANFEVFVRELGAAITSSNLMPPGTLGHAGFNVSLELSTVSLNTFKDADSPIPTDAAPTESSGFFFPTERTGFNKRSPLLIPAVHIRKGLPFSFEVGVKAAYLDRSTMAAATLEGRWAVNEGFALLPDVCVRGYATRLFNTRDFDLTVGGLDLGIGKRFAIGGMITLTPYAGWNLTFVGASSHVVDFRPERSYAESVSTPLAQADTDAGKYADVSAAPHNRFYIGGRFIGGPIQIGGEYSYSGFGTVDYGTSTYSMPPVHAFNATLGLDF